MFGQILIKKFSQGAIKVSKFENLFSLLKNDLALSAQSS